MDFFISSARNGTNKRSRKISCYNDFENKKTNPTVSLNGGDENYLKLKHPNNNNIQAKIRQQLQILRDKNFLKFTTRGKYEVI